MLPSGDQAIEVLYLFSLITIVVLFLVNQKRLSQELYSGYLYSIFIRIMLDHCKLRDLTGELEGNGHMYYCIHYSILLDFDCSFAISFTPTHNPRLLVH